MNRRDLMQLLLASAIAESVDVEKLLWVPKPVITVPAITVEQMLRTTYIHWAAMGPPEGFELAMQMLRVEFDRTLLATVSSPV